MNESTSLLLVLARCEQTLAGMLRPVLSEAGISLEQWRVVRTLSHVNYMSMKTLSELTAVPASSLTRHIDQLINAAAALRQVDPADRRKVVVALTTRGRRLADRCAGAEEQCIAEALGSASPLVGHLAELVGMLDGSARPLDTRRVS